MMFTKETRELSFLSKGCVVLACWKKYPLSGKDL